MMQKAIVSLSFDDGREDTYQVAFKIMKKYGLTGTLHVTTGFVDKTWNEERWSRINRPVTVGQLMEMKDYGFEISSHGDKHLVERNDLLESIDKLRKWNLIDKKAGFSAPDSQIPIDGDNREFIEFLQHNGISYMRGGRSQKCYSMKNKITFLFYCMTKLQFFYNKFNHFNYNPLLDDARFDQYNLISVVIRNEDDPKKIINFIKNNLQKNIWIILMLHSIRDENTASSDTWSWDLKKFEYLCARLKMLFDNKKLLIKNIMDVIDRKILFVLGVLIHLSIFLLDSGGI